MDNPIINPHATITMPSTSGAKGGSSSVSGLKGIIPKMSTKVTNNEKTLLLSSDDEFQ